MVDVPLTAGFFLAVLPAFGVMFLVYGAYEQAFKDNVLFLYLMGGGAAGLLMYLLEALLVAASVRPEGLLFGVAMAGVGFAALDQLVKTMALNRRKQQGERSSVYYGGAFGMGYAAIFAFIHSMSDFPLWRANAQGVLPPALVGVALLAIALTALHFAVGTLVGVGVAERALPRRVAQAVALAVPFQVVQFLFLRGCSVPGDPSTFDIGTCNPALLAVEVVYALAVGVWAARSLLPLGLDANQRREKRRVLRKQDA